MFAIFATSKAKSQKRIRLKMWSLTNCALILQPCSVGMFALNVQTFIISELLK